MLLNEWEFRLVMGESWDYRHEFINNFFCVCRRSDSVLLEYSIYLNDLNDILLRGKCSGCGNIASRYIETGENQANYEAAERIRQMKKSKG